MTEFTSTGEWVKPTSTAGVIVEAWGTGNGATGGGARAMTEDEYMRDDRLRGGGWFNTATYIVTVSLLAIVVVGGSWVMWG